MKGGSIEPPNHKITTGYIWYLYASMKGGSIEPPNWSTSSPLNTWTGCASMKGGSIEPPNARWEAEALEIAKLQ